MLVVRSPYHQRRYGAEAGRAADDHGEPSPRVQDAGGQLTASAAGGRFDLAAQIPLDGTGLRPAAAPGSQPGMTPALSR